MTAARARGLAQEISSGHFIVCIIFRHNVLFHINYASKLFQSPSVGMEALKMEIGAIVEFLEDFRDTGFVSASTSAREIAQPIGVELTFPEQSRRRRKIMFDYESADDGPTLLPEERFKREFFLPLVDSALTSLSERFSQLCSFTVCLAIFLVPRRWGNQFKSIHCAKVDNSFIKKWVTSILMICT